MENGTFYGAVVTVGILALLLGGVCGFALDAETITVDDHIYDAAAISKLAGENDGLKVSVDALNDTISEKDDVIADLEKATKYYADEYKDEERINGEGGVKERAKKAIETDYIDDLGFDEDEFEDSTFEIIYKDFDYDEDDGDYEVAVQFMVLEYDEDENLINEYDCNATMDVLEDNRVKHLEIQFED